MRLKRILCFATATFVVASASMLRAQQQTPAPNGAPTTEAPQGGPGGLGQGPDAGPGGPPAGRGQAGRGQGGRGGGGVGFATPTYDTTPPELPADLKAGGVLIFSKTNGFRDTPAIESSDSSLAAIAKLRGLPYFVTENGAVMNADQLSKFKLVIWNNTSGDTLNDDQKAAFKAWLEKGGTYFGIHGAGGDPVARDQSPASLMRSAASWNWLITDVLGVQFIGHAHIQPADIHIEDTKSPLTKGLPPVWHRADEWYAFSENPRSKPGFHIIAAVDEKSYDPGTNSMGADHPSIWWHCVGNGRALFSALAHGAEMYQEPLMIQFLDNSVAWGVSESGHACPK
jgi:uncharacterized protein